MPPPTLHASTNIPDANELFTRAMTYKDKGGWSGTDYIDNQRRAELLFQQMLTLYPQSNKIGDAAYQLGDIYEAKAYKFYRLAAIYFERCYQWNPTTQLDARLRAGRSLRPVAARIAARRSTFTASHPARDRPAAHRRGPETPDRAEREPLSAVG